MRNMQAQSLNNAGCCGFQRTRHRFKRILNKELARIFKLGYCLLYTSLLIGVGSGEVSEFVAGGAVCDYIYAEGFSRIVGILTCVPEGNLSLIHIWLGLRNRSLR